MPRKVDPVAAEHNFEQDSKAARHDFNQRLQLAKKDERIRNLREDNIKLRRAIKGRNEALSSMASLLKESKTKDEALNMMVCTNLSDNRK
jgi:hypothetical protein